MTRDYELMMIVHPDLDGPGIQAVIDSVRARIEQDGQVTACDFLGYRRLAYVVRKCTHGNYVLINFSAPPAAIQGIRYALLVEQSEKVIRHLLIVDEKRGTRPPTQRLPGEEPDEQEEAPSEDEDLARAAEERAMLEEAARAQAAAAGESTAESQDESRSTVDEPADAEPEPEPEPASEAESAVEDDE